MDSNHRPHPYQRCALTNWAICPYILISGMRDSNSRPLGPKPSTLAIWANPRYFSGAGRQSWTTDTRLFRPLLYRWATPACKFSMHKKHFTRHFIIKSKLISRRNWIIFYSNRPMITENRLQAILAIVDFCRFMSKRYLMMKISTKVTNTSPTIA